MIRRNQALCWSHCPHIAFATTLPHQQPELPREVFPCVKCQRLFSTAQAQTGLKPSFNESLLAPGKPACPQRP